jgi:GNAT superfamily N-acetyltransferase
MNHDDVVTAIEAAQWDFEPELSIPGVYEIRTDVLCLRISEASTSPLANKVVKSVFTEDVDRRIDEVFSMYQAHDRPFSWWVGPNSRPADLRNRLERRGMRVEDEYVGLALSTEEYAPRPVTSKWVVADAVSDEQLHGHALVSSVVWNLDPASTKTAVKERRRYVDFSHRRGGYLVVRDGAKYVGNASYRMSADGQTMYLIGGAVLPGYRRQGVYRAMVEHRLDMAKQHGCVLATTQARLGTSDPILRRLGFAEHGRFFMMVKR